MTQKKLDMACLALWKVWLVAISDVFIIACVTFHFPHPSIPSRRVHLPEVDGLTPFSTTIERFWQGLPILFNEWGTVGDVVQIVADNVVAGKGRRMFFRRGSLGWWFVFCLMESIGGMCYLGWWNDGRMDFLDDDVAGGWKNLWAWNCEKQPGHKATAATIIYLWYPSHGLGWHCPTSSDVQPGWFHTPKIVDMGTWKW